MPSIYLHHHKDFPDLLNIVEEKTGILASLVEKDYWIMHCLYGLKKQGYNFQLKGGTSLSKGFGLIDRFSEDIDIHINPPADLGINENPKYSNAKNILKKKEFYDHLTKEIKIDGIVDKERDRAFDDLKKYNSGGIRLHYSKLTGSVDGLKNGILLEAGYDTVTPNVPVNISSWAFDEAWNSNSGDLIDNRAPEIPCYDHRYTFVEKLQTIAAKFRKAMEAGMGSANFMRQYYDVYCLLGNKEVQAFLGTPEYLAHKRERFPKRDFDIPIEKNEAFLLSDSKLRAEFIQRYRLTNNLYYKGQPPFEEVMDRIRHFAPRL